MSRSLAFEHALATVGTAKALASSALLADKADPSAYWEGSGGCCPEISRIQHSA